MIVKTYCQDGRADALNTATSRTRVCTAATSSPTGSSTSPALCVRTACCSSPCAGTPRRDRTRPRAGGPPTARRRDGLYVVIADSEDMPRISMVTVDGKLALLCMGDNLADCNHLA